MVVILQKVKNKLIKCIDKHYKYDIIINIKVSCYIIFLFIIINKGVDTYVNNQSFMCRYCIRCYFRIVIYIYRFQIYSKIINKLVDEYLQNILLYTYK